jgi:thioredoxin reductase (NADPH)
MANHHAKLLIIGSGPAGYTAAIYAARALVQPVLISGFSPGGQLMITTDVENYPGFASAVQGPQLMEDMRKQAEHVGARLVSDHVTAVNLSQRPFRISCDSGDTYSCDALVIATGAQARWLGIPSEETFKGFGVSACATCDGFFFRGKAVAVVGGGNSAMEEALYLANIAARVTMVHRRDAFRGEKILQERVARHPKIDVIWDHVVDEIVGTDAPRSVTELQLKHARTGVERRLPVDGVFVAIGHAPATELFAGQVRIKPNGYIWTAPYSTATDVPGVYAAGDVADDVFRQAVTAAGMGCMAALESERWLATLDVGQNAAA